LSLYHSREHLLTAKRKLSCEWRLTCFSSRTAQDATTGDRLHLLLSQSAGSLVFFLSRAFWLICRSEFQAIAHNVFMALPPYTSTREGEACQLGRAVRKYPHSTFSVYLFSKTPE